MDEYISREAAVRYLKGFSEKELNWNAQFGTITSSVLDKAERAISEMPAADVQPVKHGRWIKHRIDDPKSILYGAVKDTTCSVCGKSTPYNTEYCMHCGARMDEEE